MSGAIDKLYRLSFKIRNPATRLGFSNARFHREEDPETGVDLIERYRDVDQRHVNEVIASQREVSAAHCVDDYLVYRLAQANTLRRQQFKKWQHHSTKMKLSRAQEHYLWPLNLAPHQRSSPISPFRTETPSVPTTATCVLDLRAEPDDAMSQVSISTYAVLSRDLKGTMSKFRSFLTAYKLKKNSNALIVARSVPGVGVVVKLGSKICPINGTTTSNRLHPEAMS